MVEVDARLLPMFQRSFANTQTVAAPWGRADQQPQDGAKAGGVGLMLSMTRPAALRGGHCCGGKGRLCRFNAQMTFKRADAIGAWGKRPGVWRNDG